MRRAKYSMFRHGLVAVVALGVLAATTLPAAARDETHSPRGRQSAFNLGTSSTFLLNFNEWLCGLTQLGNVCSSAVGSSVGGGGFWPSGTANQYIFNSGLQIAAVVGDDGGSYAGDTLTTFFFNASGGQGSAAWAPIYSSTRPEDLAAWPEDCYIDNPVFGRVKTLSELDTCVQYWDGDPTASHFTDSKPMGILVTQHSLLWSFPSNKDIMFFLYKFENVTNRPEFRQRNPEAPAGGYTLTSIYSAFSMDPDVSGNDYADNYATVVPDLNLGVTWNTDFEADEFVPYAPNFDAAPGFVGVKFLKSPVNTSDETMTIRVGADVREVAPGEELGLTFFSVTTNGGIMSDANNGRQGFRYLSGQLTSTERTNWCPTAPPGMCYVDLQAPNDMRFYQSSGPFSLAPGESAEIVVAYLAGAPVPGTYEKGTQIPVGDVTDPTRAIEAVMGRGYDVAGFPSLFANANTAQAIFDADFVLPSSPTAPQVSVVPGNEQNTVIWNASPVDLNDPYCSLATDPDNALYDPNFVCNDFEGFRVYRKSNPAADWTLIGQFDRSNGITEVVTVLEEVETADGSTLVIRADTARVCNVPGCQSDTGLKFAIVDRGGPFPAPQNGPGLTNGVRYYYAVTAFDINSPFSGPSSLESARVLSNNASGVPRSTASGAVAARIGDVQLFGSGDTPLDPSAETEIDATTGAFAGPQPPTNGFNAVFQAYDPLLLKAGALSVKIDSVVALNGYEELLGDHQQLNPGGCLAPLSVAYFTTVTTPAGSSPYRSEFPFPYAQFSGCETSAEAELANAPIAADQQRAQQLGIDANYFAGAISAQVEQEYGVENSGQSAVSVLRTHRVDESNRSRWFVGSEPARPVDVFDAGTLPGIADIHNLAVAYQSQSDQAEAREVDPGTYAVIRWQSYLLSPYQRAVDYEVTWGESGTIASVQDLTHNLAVSFSDHYGATWGIRNEVSGDGILSQGDFWLVTPVAEWYCEFAGCHAPLEQTAVIQPISSVAPWIYNTDVEEATGTGFGLYIGGETFIFETAALPAAGTKWILRTYHGEIVHEDDGTFTFESRVRPPAVPGLTAQLTVEAPTEFNMAEADLTRVHTVPDPYYVTNSLESTLEAKRFQFVNLPTQAVIRIYTLSGVLVAALDHNDPAGGGTYEWDLRSRNNQFLASGVYFYHVEAPNGDEKIGKFTIVQYAQ